jgi:ribosomal protein S18 acetylase RimI-like enzyme
VTADDLRYTADASNLTDVIAHLAACDSHFVPPLSTRVELEAYAAKLVERARRIEAWNGRDLVGLVAAYINESDRGWFVTNVSTHPEFARRGVASQLMFNLLALSAGSEVRLEVSARNDAARALYAAMDFVVDSQAGDKLTLVRSRSRSLGPGSQT